MVGEAMFSYLEGYTGLKRRLPSLLTPQLGAATFAVDVSSALVLGSTNSWRVANTFSTNLKDSHAMLSKVNGGAPSSSSLPALLPTHKSHDALYAANSTSRLDN